MCVPPPDTWNGPVYSWKAPVESTRYFVLAIVVFWPVAVRVTVVGLKYHPLTGAGESAAVVVIPTTA